MKETKTLYEAPLMTVETVSAESGFANSPEITISAWEEDSDSVQF